MSKLSITVAIDLGKRSFHVRAEDEHRRCVLDRAVSRSKLLETVLQLKPAQVGMEAGGGAHHWGRCFEANGVAVRLLPPQYVRPYRRGDKNDANDAEAILEAMRRPTLRSVPVKTLGQQDLQLALRAREGDVGRRTQLINEMRAACLEYGYCVLASTAKLASAVRLVRDETPSMALRTYLDDRLAQLQALEETIREKSRAFDRLCRAESLPRRMRELSGIGPITAAAVLATVADPTRFKNGRQFAAFIGLVPRQYSTGGRARLRGIAKDGNRYLRQLLIHGGRSVLKTAGRHEDAFSQWAIRKKNERGFNKACVAVANKNARRLWALMAEARRAV